MMDSRAAAMRALRDCTIIRATRNAEGYRQLCDIGLAQRYDILDHLGRITSHNKVDFKLTARGKIVAGI